MGQGQALVVELMEKHDLAGSVAENLAAYKKEMKGALLSRAEEIFGAERENVLKNHRVIRMRMNPEHKAPSEKHPEGMAKFRCLVMGHTEPKEWSEGGTDSPVASAESARLLVFSGEQCEENEHEVIGAVDIDTAFLQGIAIQWRSRLLHQ